MITEDPPPASNFSGAAASVTGIVGVAERGPVGVAVLCTSLEAFQHHFGGYVEAHLAPAVRGFFDNGGRHLHVVRIAHYVDAAVPSTLTARCATGAVTYEKATVAEVQARTPGTYGNGLRVDFTVTGDGVHIEISWHAKRLEQWQRLSGDPESPNFYAHVLNTQSRYLRVGLADPEKAPPIASQTVMLAQGEDGLTGLSDADWVGDSVAKTGMRALDRVLDLALLVIPGASPEVQRAMVAYCEQIRRGSVLALLDAPAAAGAQATAHYVEVEKLGELSEHAAMYWPWVLVGSPAVAVPPSAFVAGVVARATDTRPGGIYTPPAGLLSGQLRGIAGLAHDDCLDEAQRDIVYPARINPLSTGASLPYFIDGSRTLKASGACPWVAQRRGLSFIERSLDRKLQQLRHRLMTSALTSEAYRDVTSFLMTQLRDGAFASQNPPEAFSVQVWRSPQTATLEVAVGVAFAQPAEFIWLHMRVALGGSDATVGVN